VQIPKTLGRTLESVARGDILLPIFEEGLSKADWPKEYPIKVFNKEREWDGYFHPSSDIAPGPLKLYYLHHPKYKNVLVPERITPTLQLTFQIGSAFHSLFESMFVHLGLTTLEECEVTFKNEEHHVTGTLDIRNVTLPDGTKVLVDFKTCTSLPNQPDSTYVAQVRTYLDLAPEAPALGLLLYIEKPSPHRLREFIVRPNPDEQSLLYRKWRMVREAIEFDDPSSLQACCMGPPSSPFNNCPAFRVCEKYNK
jgi:hypothetical protein